MQVGQPSRTAFAAATHRTAHQVLERGRIFSDPLAVRILGSTDAAIATDAAQHQGRRGMRLFIAVRSRVAEDAVAVFEVDHPSTQAWKRARLIEAGIDVPAWLTFAPVNFEHQTLADGLAAAGFDKKQPAIFTWLGVVPYLTHDAIDATLGYIAGLASAEVVFDYGESSAALAPEQRAAHDARAARVAALGEPWVSSFEPAALATHLRSMGFASIDDLGPAQIAQRYFGVTTVGPARAGGHIVRAAR